MLKLGTENSQFPKGLQTSSLFCNNNAIHKYMSKLKFWLTTTRIKLGSLFFGRYLGSSRKVVKPKNDREEDASLTSDLERSRFFFFYVHVFCGMSFNEKQTARWKSLTFIPICFSNFWSSSNHNDDGNNNGTLHKASHARSFSFFAHLFAFLCKTTRNLII